MIQQSLIQLNLLIILNRDRESKRKISTGKDLHSAVLMISFRVSIAHR